jgi:hypothetical protein
MLEIVTCNAPTPHGSLPRVKRRELQRPETMGGLAWGIGDHTPSGH